MLDPDPAQIILKILPGIFLKKAAEIIRIHMDLLRQHLQRKILVIMLVYINLCTQKILTAAAHYGIFQPVKVFHDNSIAQLIAAIKLL